MFTLNYSFVFVKYNEFAKCWMIYIIYNYMIHSSFLNMHWFPQGLYFFVLYRYERRGCSNENLLISAFEYIFWRLAFLQKKNWQIPVFFSSASHLKVPSLTFKRNICMYIQRNSKDSVKCNCSNSCMIRITPGRVNHLFFVTYDWANWKDMAV